MKPGTLLEYTGWEGSRVAVERSHPRESDTCIDETTIPRQAKGLFLGTDQWGSYRVLIICLRENTLWSGGLFNKCWKEVTTP